MVVKLLLSTWCPPLSLSFLLLFKSSRCVWYICKRNVWQVCLVFVCLSVSESCSLRTQKSDQMMTTMININLYSTKRMVAKYKMKYKLKFSIKTIQEKLECNRQWKTYAYEWDDKVAAVSISTARRTLSRAYTSAKAAVPAKVFYCETNERRVEHADHSLQHVSLTTTKQV